MEKVKVSKQVAETIEYALNMDVYREDKSSLIKNHVDVEEPWCGGFRWLNGIPLDTLIRALYIGYEVETTPEEKVRQHFENLLDAGMHNEANVIHITLDNLNIKIEGVNA